MNPLFVILGLGALALLLFSDTEEPAGNAAAQNSGSGNSEPPPPDQNFADSEFPASQPITLEILREIFHNGTRPLSRRDAVEILKAAPYCIPKTNAYRALARSRRFVAHLQADANGWLHFIP